MFLRKYWIPLSVFFMAIAGVGLYYLQTQPPKDAIVIYKPVEPLPKSEVKAPVGDTSQDGHFHADGTWHAGSHDAPVAETPLSDETEAETIDATETLDLIDAFLPDDTATLEDPVLAELNAERLELKQRQRELNDRLETHISAVVGRRITASELRPGNVVSGNADGLTESQVIAELEELRIGSENLRKAQVEWRRKYIEHTGKEYPGTEHWVPHVARDPEEVHKLLHYEMGSRGWIIVDP